MKGHVGPLAWGSPSEIQSSTCVALQIGIHVLFQSCEENCNMGSLEKDGCAVLGEINQNLIEKTRKSMPAEPNGKFHRQNIFPFNNECEACFEVFDKVSAVDHPR